LTGKTITINHAISKSLQEV